MSRDPVAGMRALGLRVELVEFPSVGHTMNDQMWGKLQTWVQRALEPDAGAK
jgi:hypothetical protein